MLVYVVLPYLLGDTFILFEEATRWIFTLTVYGERGEM